MVDGSYASQRGEGRYGNDKERWQQPKRAAQQVSHDTTPATEAGRIR